MKLTEQFPRTTDLPSQSSKFWVKEKDRHIRQLLISDLEQALGRKVIVYFAQLNESISPRDADDLSEIIEGVDSKDIDLIIQTPGGSADAVEKFITVLKLRLNSYRVIVPNVAKSGGTVIAMSSTNILLGVNSELGPIDPQMMITNLGFVPCEFIAQEDSEQPAIYRKVADSSVQRMRILARKVLQNGLLSDKTEKDTDVLIDKISSSDTYKSHGAVIDYDEAKKIGLQVEWLEPTDRIWKLVWLLYCCYDQDTRAKNIGKIVEEVKYSIEKQSSYVTE